MKREGDGGQPLHFVILITSLFLAPLSSPLRILRMKKSCKSRPWTSWWTLHTGCRWMAWCLTCHNSHQVSPVVDLVFCEKWKVPKPNTQVHHYLKLLWQWHLAQVQVSARLHQPVQLRFCQFNLTLVCWHLPLLKYPSEASAAWHASPKNYLVQFQKQWGMLTCTPDQVKKLLYCTKQKGSQASTGSSSTQDVSDRKVIHFLKHHMFLWFCFLCGIQVSWSMHLLLFILKYQSSCLLEELLVEVGSGKFLG